MSATRRCLLALVVLAPIVNQALRYAPFSWSFRRSVVAATMCGQHIPNATDVILAEELGSPPLAHQLTLTHVGGFRVRMAQLEGW